MPAGSLMAADRALYTAKSERRKRTESVVVLRPEQCLASYIKIVSD